MITVPPVKCKQKMSLHLSYSFSAYENGQDQEEMKDVFLILKKEHNYMDGSCTSQQIILFFFRLFLHGNWFQHWWSLRRVNGFLQRKIKKKA